MSEPDWPAVASSVKDLVGATAPRFSRAELAATHQRMVDDLDSYREPTVTFYADPAETDAELLARFVLLKGYTVIMSPTAKKRVVEAWERARAK